VDLDLVGAHTDCHGTWDVAGTASTTTWCPDCSLSFDADMTLTAQTGGCDFSDLSQSFGVWEDYGDYDAVVYLYDSKLYYWGRVYLDGDSLTFIQDYDGYTDYGAGYYDYYYFGTATLY